MDSDNRERRGGGARRAVGAVALLLALGAIYGCSMYGTTSGGLVKGAGWTGGGTAGVSISQYSFNPTPLAFPAASSVTVTWTNNDGVTHTVTSDDGRFTSSGNVGSGMTFSATFPAAGTYTYHCSIHTEMKGTITVN